MDKKGNSGQLFPSIRHTIHPTRGLFFGALILGALLAFELFNFTTTDYALTDLMGNIRFLDVRWATILALAFCGIDFAGIARLFTPEKGTGQPREVWYLFGAWLLAATMNAMLTWWGVAIAILSHTSLGASVLSPNTLVRVVPIFVALMVWIIRVLIIGSFSIAGSRIFSQAELAYQAPHTVSSTSIPSPAVPAQATSFHPIPKPDARPSSQAEGIYHPASMSGSNHGSHELRK